MHVISEKKLREFWRRHPRAETVLRAWAKVVERTSWRHLTEVKASFPATDQVGKFTVFDIGGNKYRLVAVIHFNRGKLYVRHVLTHKEYTLGRWKED